MTKDLSSPDHDQDEPARPGPETRWQHTRQDWRPITVHQD